MSNIDDLLADDKKILSADKKKYNSDEEYFPMVEGEYLGYIVEPRMVEREFKMQGKKVKATIFNYKVRIGEENGINTYTIPSLSGQNRTVKGDYYADKVVQAKGVFKYHEPAQNDEFEAYNDGNKSYVMFCETMGFEGETVEGEVGGKKIVVNNLPEFQPEELYNKPVVAVVGPGKPWFNSKGEKCKSWEVKFVKKWKKATKSEELPF